jgi:hypothetical protein
MSILLLDLTSPEKIPLINYIQGLLVESRGLKPLVFLLLFSGIAQYLLDAGV